MPKNDNSWQGTGINRRDVVKGIGAVAAGTAAAGAASETVRAGDETAMLQYFHTSWNDLRNDLSRVADAGFAAVHVPPPQESRLTPNDQGDDHPEYGDDYPYHPPLGYQPMDRTSLDSEFGDEAEFRAMIDEAHSHGIEVVVDVVMNHNAAEVPLDEFPNFGEEHFYQEGDIEDWMYDYDPNDDRCYDENEWECDPWMIEHGDLLGLPSLDLTDDHVQSVLYDFVERVADCGADGVRWDASKHMHNWFYEDHANQWADGFDLYRAGEVLHGPIGYVDEYAQTGMDVTDYPLYYTLEDAFSSGGDLRALDDDGAGYVEQNPFGSLTFVANHDSAPPEYEELARAYVLTYEGYPRVYNYLVDLDDDDLRNLLWIRNNLLGGPAITRHVDEDYVIFEREDNALVCINKSGDWRGEWVYTSWRDEWLNDYTGNTDGTDVNGDGWTEAWSPPMGWSVYAP